MANDNRVMTVFSWYQFGMRRVGKRARFPRSADKKKTYLWRQLNAFADKIEDLGIDDSTARDLVNTILRYGKENKLLDRGASLLAKADLFEIYDSKLNVDLRAEYNLILEIKRCALFLSEQQKQNPNINVLLSRKRSGAYANLTCWFQSGKLTKSFIALSKNCCQALNKLDESERAEFPPDIEILKIRVLCLQDKQRARKINAIMGSDLHRRRQWS